MKVDGLNADNPTPILNFNVGASNPTTIGSASGGAGAGKVSFSALNVTKMLDGLSVALPRAAAPGQHFPHVTIEVFEAGRTSPFAIYTFGLVFVTSDVIGSGENGVPRLFRCDDQQRLLKGAATESAVAASRRIRYTWCFLPLRTAFAGVRSGGKRPPCSSVAQWQSIRLLTGGLLVRVQPEEPLFRTNQCVSSDGSPGL